MTRRPPISILFPYTTLFRSTQAREAENHKLRIAGEFAFYSTDKQGLRLATLTGGTVLECPDLKLQIAHREHTDRKSTRLNSSHEWISYAVFCLKKKKKNTDK